MNLLFFSFISIFVFSLSALAETNSCYLNEKDPKSHKAFNNAEIYGQTVQEWRQKAPEFPNPLDLIKAYGIYKKEKEQALGLKTDKQSHCFIGCRISQEVNSQTAEYVGWLKEDQDLRDCKLATHFDEVDFEATLVGARFGEFEKTREACLQSCVKQKF